MGDNAYQVYAVPGGFHAADRVMRIACYGASEAEAVLNLREAQKRRAWLLQLASEEEPAGDAGGRA
jgi:hypothetical protein